MIPKLLNINTSVPKQVVIFSFIIFAVIMNGAVEESVILT